MEYFSKIHTLDQIQIIKLVNDASMILPSLSVTFGLNFILLLFYQLFLLLLWILHVLSRYNSEKLFICDFAICSDNSLLSFIVGKIHKLQHKYIKNRWKLGGKSPWFGLSDVEIIIDNFFSAF